ncbi:MAG TPA: tetratricopeptide repeat protein [Polyangia bacterium]
MRRIALALALFVVAPLVPARADWQVTRSPFDPALVARLERALATRPDDAAALSRLITLYRRYRTLDALTAEYTARAARHHDFADELVLGHLYRARGDHAHAADHYRLALAARPGDAHAELALAGEEVALKRADLARPLYLSAAKATRDPKAKRALLRKLADLALAPDRGLPKAEAVAEARTYFDQMLALDPKDDDTRRELAEALAQAGAYDDASVEWRKIADHLGADPAARTQAWLRIGELEESGGHDDRAKSAYDRAYRLAPRGHYLRRAAIEKLIGVARKHDELRALAGSWERDWPAEGRGFDEWDTLARLYDELGDAPRAESCFRQALAKDARAVDARRHLIALLEREQRPTEVIAEYRKLIASAPGEPKFRLELAEKLWAQDGAKEALAIAERLGHQTRDPQVHGQLAELYQRWSLTAVDPAARRRLGALALAERELLVRLEPSEATHLIDLGELYFQRGRKEQALATWRRLLTLGGKKPAEMARLADVYADHDLPGEALELYQKAVKLAPDDLALRKGLAAALERMHRDREAEAAWQDLFDRAIAKKQPQLELEVRGRWVATLERTGRLSARLPDFRARFDRAGDAATLTAYGLLTADSELKLGKLDEAETVLEALGHRAPDDETRAESLIGLAQVYRARHQPKRVIAALEAAAKLSPRRARELYSQIAALSLELYRDSDALTYAKKAIELGPTDAQAQLKLAEVLEKRDQLDGAEAAYRRALELDDRLWKAHFVLARLQLRRGEYAEAARLYRDVIRRAPDEQQVVDAARRALDLDEYLGSLTELEHELGPLAYAHPDKKVYRNLLVELYGRYAGPLLQPARAGDANARAKLKQLGEHALRPLLDVLVDGEPAQKRLAVELLGQLDNESAIGPLLELAQPKRHARALPGAPAVDAIDLRVGAALAAAELATPKSAGALARLAEDPEKEIRIAALFGLGRTRAPEAEAALVRGLSDGNGEVAATACLGLARQRSGSGSFKPLAEVVRLLRDPAEPEVARAACAVALGAISGAPERELAVARRALLQTLSEGAGEVEAKAAWAYGAIAPTGPLPKEAAQALLTAIFVKRDPVRRAAIEALAHHPAPLAFSAPPRSEDGLDVRGWVAWLGAASPTSPSVPPSLWRGDEAQIAQAIVDALSRHRDVVLRTLADLDGRSGELALGPLATAALEPSDRKALATLGAQLLPAVEQVSHDADPLVRAAATRVLVELPGGLPRAIAALSDPAPEVRLATVEALGACVDPSTNAAAAGAPGARERLTADALTRALGAADWRERRAAAFALGGALSCPGPGHPDAARRLLPALTSAELKDESGFVREAARDALERARRN